LEDQLKIVKNQIKEEKKTQREVNAQQVNNSILSNSIVSEVNDKVELL
jgi:hypothetical protein